jgi:hypothetical protein
MHSDGNKKKKVSGHSSKVKLEILEEELENCQALSGYMASANIVQSYLEKRVFALEQEVNLNHGKNNV